MKGIYVLVISVSKDVKVDIGALGSISFEKGLYAYVGSAQSGLERRVKRHLGRVKRKFWHIDHLLDNKPVKVVKVFYNKAGKSEECRIAEELGESGIAVMNFGCSDCSCISHLYKVENYDFLRDFMFELQL